MARLTFLLIILSPWLNAGTATAQAEFTGQRMLTAAPTNGIQVDGVLDDADWQSVQPGSDFITFRPNEGEPSSQKTEVRVLYGKNAIYVGAMLYDTEPDRIRRILTRRDETNGADMFLAAFDSYNDKKTAYMFGVTAAGVQFDAILTGNGDDDSWDAVWDSAVRVTPEGWCLEMAIPYSQLRFTEGGTTWGVEFQRQIRRVGEESFWAPLTSDQTGSGIVQFFGRLEGLQDVSPRRVLQVAPYTLARANRFESAVDAGSASADYDAKVGVDFKVGLSSNVTLDATINPDFGQVDADPAQLNLTTFETFFQERRPFFLEGTQIFDFTYGSGDGALLYTRRIGGDAPIIGASKVSGRLASGLSVGVLAAATGQDRNPDRWYGATRIKQEFGSQNYVGAALTGFSASDESSADVQTITGGGDWDLRVGADDQWKFEGSLAGSIRSVDGVADDLKGYALYVGFDQVKGNFTPGSGLRIYSPDFQINDVGRFRQTNLLQARVGGNQRWNKGEPFGPFLRAETGGFTDQNWRYDDGTYRGSSINIFSFAQFTNFWSANLFASIADVGGVDVRETRGLGPISNIRNGGINLGVDTDSRKRFELEPGIGFWLGEDGGTTINGELEFNWNASDQIELSSEVGYDVSDNWTAWTANESIIDIGGDLFIGTNPGRPDGLVADDLVALPSTAASLLDGLTPYEGDLQIANATGYYYPVFGSRDTRTFNWSTRANVIFTPKLSLQLYGQLFAARGRFSDFSLLANKDELRSFAYPKQPDFSFQSFQANTVLRWEFRPGSALFVVWTQSRNLREAERLLTSGGLMPRSPFDQGTGDQLRDTFSVFPDNVFLVKFSYLIGR